MTIGRLDAILPRSLFVRAWLAVGVIVFFAVATASISGVLAWISKSDANAINSAGTIRMATYRINYLMATKTSNPIDDIVIFDKKAPVITQLVGDMDRRLNALYHYQTMLGNKDTLIDSQTQILKLQWQTTLKPAILANDTTATLAASTSFIKQADTLIQSIQERNERRQYWQQALQISALVIISLILLMGMRELKCNVLKPIRSLIYSTQQFRMGRYEPTPLMGYREFRTLGKSFNNMARTISTHQAHLSQEVQNKTRHLTQANQLLTLLYNFSNQLNQEPVTLSKLHHLLADFSKINPSMSFTLCLHDHLRFDEYDEQADNVVSSIKKDTAATKDSTSSKDSVSIHTHFIDEPIKHTQPLGKVCTANHCQTCQLKARHGTQIHPINAQNSDWGELMVHQEFADNNSIASAEMVHALVNLISLVFTIQKQRQQEHQLILLEERSTIARELHDSLAQSLSYLKIQLAMLGTYARQISDVVQSIKTSDDTTVKPSGAKELNERELNEANDSLMQVLSQARTGLDSAYTQLRELLVTFRLTIESGSFDTAIAQACDEFAAKGDFDIVLDNRILSQNLSASEQIDLLQITREALSNIQRHAHAHKVSVILYQKMQADNGQKVYLEIADDGVGLSKAYDGQQHHGLKIMQERTRSLGGVFDIRQNTPKGTLVQICFLPQFFAKAVVAKTDSQAIT